MSAASSRVIALGPMPPEKCAYALARYSRSPDSIRDSLEWVRAHGSSRFFEHYYFQYGHSSIADLGHLAICFEGISELAAVEIEDEPLWDGQARSTRYQDFSRSGFVMPPELTAEQADRYREAASALLEAYFAVQRAMEERLRQTLPRPPEMPQPTYERNLRARALDVARYLLFLGISTSVGQVTSIRTLEKQIRRLKASDYLELRQLAEQLKDACRKPPELLWDPGSGCEPLAPTLAQWVETDEYLRAAREELRLWARQNLPSVRGNATPALDLIKPTDACCEVAATLLYWVTDRPFRELYELVRSWSERQRREVIDLAVRHRTDRDELLRAFRSAPYVFDVVIDIGAYRDLHRHRRCHQIRQDFTPDLGHEVPEAVRDAGLEEHFKCAIDRALSTAQMLPAPACHYLLPFACRVRCLFKMDLAEIDYICRVRTTVKGHFSYRRIAWEMKNKLEELEPGLKGFIQATPPWVEDPLRR